MSGEFIREYKGHQRGLACVKFRGNLIASGSNDQTVKLWDVETGACLRNFVGHTDLVRTLAFNDKWLVTGSYDQTIKIWDINTEELLVDLKQAHSSWVFHVALDGHRIISSSQDKSIGVWEFGVGVECLEELV